MMVTPLIWVGPATVDVVDSDSPRAAEALVKRGTPVRMPSLSLAAVLLGRLGSDSSEVERLMSFARSQPQ